LNERPFSWECSLVFIDAASFLSNVFLHEIIEREKQAAQNACFFVRPVKRRIEDRFCSDRIMVGFPARYADVA